MFIGIIIALLIGVLFAGIRKADNADYGDETGIAMIALSGLSLFIILFVLAVGCIKWQPSAKSLTGYIYQRQEAHGYVEYSLRFSQQAGMDEQPSFCTEAGSEEDKKIAQYVGTDVKVQINSPKRGLTVDDFWGCTSFAQLDKVIKEDVRTKED